MSCMITHHNGYTVVKGTRPKKPGIWNVRVWFILKTGEKHTHSVDISNQMVDEMPTIIGYLMDGLIADHGNQVDQVGWSAITHGKKS